MSKKNNTTKTTVVPIRASLDSLTMSFGIDKVVIDLDEKFRSDTILNKPKIKLAKKRIGYDRAVKVDDWLTFVYQGGTEYFYRIIAKGGDFNRYNQFESALSALVPKKSWNRYTINDIEYKIDFRGLPFNEVSSHLYVAGKKTLHRIVDRGIDTTKYFGQKPIVQVLYDKERESGQVQHQGISRFETRYNGYVLGEEWTRKLSDLRAISLSEDFNPFQNVFYLDYELNDSSCCRCKIFRALTEIVGFQRARAYFNQNRNFAREKKTLFTNYSETCLGDFYHSEMRKYFEKQGE